MTYRTDHEGISPPRRSPHDVGLVGSVLQRADPYRQVCLYLPLLPNPSRYFGFVLKSDGASLTHPTRPTSSRSSKSVGSAAEPSLLSATFSIESDTTS